MSEIKALADFLKSHIKKKPLYAVPKAWVPANYTGTVSERDSHVFVDPYEYFYLIIEDILKTTRGRITRSLWQHSKGRRIRVG